MQNYTRSPRFFYLFLSRIAPGAKDRVGFSLDWSRYLHASHLLIQQWGSFYETARDNEII